MRHGLRRGPGFKLRVALLEAWSGKRETIYAMYCPNCGTIISSEQSFCRSCGLGLEKIAQSLVEQRPNEFEESLQQRKERIERWGVAALSVFGLGVASIPLYKIVMMMLEGRVLAGLGFLALMVVLGCGLLAVILFAKANEVAEAKIKGRAASPEALPKPNKTAKLLPSDQLDSIPSVTERTTELLFAEKKAKDKD